MSLILLFKYDCYNTVTIVFCQQNGRMMGRINVTSMMLEDAKLNVVEF